MLKIIKILITAVQKGLPVWNTIKKLFQEKKFNNVEALIELGLEIGAVYLFVWAIHKFGVTVEDIVELFGMFK